MKKFILGLCILTCFSVSAKECKALLESQDNIMISDLRMMFGGENICLNNSECGTSADFALKQVSKKVKIGMDDFGKAIYQERMGFEIWEDGQVKFNTTEIVELSPIPALQETLEKEYECDFDVVGLEILGLGKSRINSGERNSSEEPSLNIDIELIESNNGFSI